MIRPVPSRRHAIAEDLRHRISSGHFKPGERLPSETQLATHYKVSTSTLRSALAVLQGEGLVDKIHGKGNFVRRPLRRITHTGGAGVTENNELRLLPWAGPDDKPCYLSAEEPAGYLSRLADNTEEIQLGLGAQLLAHAIEVLSDVDSDPEELHALAADLTGALRNAVRVATSRGRRLAHPAHSTYERLQAHHD
ncbi:MULTISPECIES: GntR family transcriptional regulator [unclassified Streptomyces]|uniref:GntR family transcriptional regulator n=1 Tax=Streptomyces sp. NRRL S-98 TaxID=1463922 RepID=UPI000B0601FC|nr:MULTISPECIES: GntR family transcriptional regulator [unclassified Streptomyces]